MRTMPLRSPSASSSARPRQIATSSIVWCASMCRSPVAFDRQVEQAVMGDVVQHVVEKADAGVDLGCAAAVQVQRQLDLRFVRVAGDRLRSGQA